jgi:2-oxoglutarate ferredoxin oxidoreductase subunit gamma
MHAEIAIAGSGGQGVLLAGRLLAEAGCREGREVVWMPSYGAEKRGGAVFCAITISDSKIGALCITHPSAAIAMNQAAAARLEPLIKPGGVLIINESSTQFKVKRDDFRTIYVPAGQMASELGNDSVSNLVALGTLVFVLPVVSAKSIATAMEAFFPANAKALKINQQALVAGLDRLACLKD